MRPHTWISIEQDSSAIDEHNETSLWRAVSQGRGELVHLFINTGADVNSISGFRGETPLHVAAYKGYLDILITLIKAGADVNQPTTDTSGWYPIHLACCTSFDNKQVIEELIKAGVSVDTRDITDRTPLHLAFVHGNASNCKTLIELGANMSLKEWYGRTPRVMIGKTPDKNFFNIIRQAMIKRYWTVLFKRMAFKHDLEHYTKICYHPITGTEFNHKINKMDF